jgi:hypothetical protein
MEPILFGTGGGKVRQTALVNKVRAALWAAIAEW